MAPDPSDPLDPRVPRDPSRASVPESAQAPLKGNPVVQPPTARSPVKWQTLQLLRTTIQTLEAVVERLESAPEPEADLPIPQQIQTTLGLLIAPMWSRWRGALGHLRRVLPRSLNQRMSDAGLTGAIVSTLLLVLLSIPILRTPPKPAIVVAVSPSPVPASSPRPFLAPLPAKTPVADSGSPQPEPPVPPAAPELTPTPEVVPSPAPLDPAPLAQTPPTDAASQNSPSDDAPVADAPLGDAPDTSAPPPEAVVERSPEDALQDALIASIQDKMTTVSAPYADALVQAVQPNFRRSWLRITLGDGWDSLEAAQQDALANALLEQAQRLDFSKLELVRRGGDRLARSPVVGADMIILQRAARPSA